MTRAALGFGGLVALVRIGQGGHFLSDNIFAALLVGAVAWGLHRWIVEDDGLDRPWARSQPAVRTTRPPAAAADQATPQATPLAPDIDAEQ